MREPRVNELLKRMTLAEKIGQMCQAHGTGDENRKLVREGRVGSLLNAGDVASINEFQDWAKHKALIDTLVPQEQFWDPRFIDYANQVLGAMNP